MKAYYYEAGLWNGTGSLGHALRLGGRIRASRTGENAGPFVIALTGAGGKTSAIRRLAFEALEQELKVLVATTTHMACPENFGVLTGSRDEAAAALADRGLAVVGRMAEKGKIAFVGYELYEALCPLADLVLVEADGSRRLPLKVPGEGEPVIPCNTDMILCLSGLSSLGRRADECCLRLKQARAIMERYGRQGYDPYQGEESRGNAGWTITERDMMCLMRYGYLEPLRRMYPGVTVAPVFSQADTPDRWEAARDMLRGMEETLGIFMGQLLKDPSAGLF